MFWPLKIPIDLWGEDAVLDTGLGEGDSGLKKSQINMVSSCEEDTIWKSSNCNLKTRPVCSIKVRRHKVPAGERGSKAAAKSQTLILLYQMKDS